MMLVHDPRDIRSIQRSELDDGIDAVADSWWKIRLIASMGAISDFHTIG